MKIHDMTNPWGFLRMNILLILLLLALAMVSGSYLGHAANHYILESASGSADGSDWTNAWTALPSPLTRGDTYYIGDGSYPTYIFDDAESGTSVIKILKATESAHGTETGWDSAYGDGQAVWNPYIRWTTGYWIWDGVVGSGSDTTSYGFRVIFPNPAQRNHALGPSGYGYSNRQVNNISIMHTATTLPGSAYDYQQCGIYSAPVSEDYAADSLRIAYNYFGNASSSMIIRDWKRSIIEHNYFDANWSSSAQHGQSISPGNRCTDIVVRNNIFNDPFVFIVGVHRSDNPHWDFFNNIVIGGTLSGGLCNVDTDDEDCMTNWHMHHNTFLNVNFGGFGAMLVGNVSDDSLNSRAYNNLFINCTNCKLTNPTFTSGAIEYDYNAYYYCTSYTPGANAIESANPAPVVSETAPINLDLTKSFDGVVQDSLDSIARTTDYEDSTISDPPDIGAYEFNAGEEAAQDSISYYYLSTTGGGDTLATVAEVLAVADSGDVVYALRGGVWREGWTIPDDYITLSAYGNPELPLPVFSGWVMKTGWSYDAVGGGASEADTLTIAKSVDDGRYRSDGNFTNSATVVTHGNSSGTHVGYYRVQVPSIGQGDTIDSLLVEMYNTGDDRSNPVLFTWAFEDTSNSLQIDIVDDYTSAHGNLTSTTVNDSIHDPLDNTAYTSANLAPIMQYIVDKPTWAADNWITIFGNDRGSATNAYLYPESWDEEGDHTPYIRIYWTPQSAADSTIVAVDLTGGEQNFTVVLFDGSLGIAVGDSTDLDAEDEYWHDTAENKLWVRADDISKQIEIDGIGYGIDTNEKTGTTVSNIKLTGFNLAGLFDDGDGTSFTYAWLDSMTRKFVDLGANAITMNNLTTDGTFAEDDTTEWLDNASNNNIVISVAKQDTTGGNNVTYSNLYDSEAIGGTGNETFDPQLGTDGKPDSLYWADNGDYWGYGYYAIGSITVTAPDGGETYTVGETITVTWTYTGGNPADSIIVKTSDDGYTSNEDTLSASTGTADITAQSTASENMTVIVQSYEDNLVSDESDAVFTIEAAAANRINLSVNGTVTPLTNLLKLP